MLTKKIKEIILSEALIPRGGHVVVGISGGPDSLTLAHVLLQLSGELGFALHAVHVDHGLRGAESDGDRQFVEDWCASSGLPLTVKRIDIAALAAERSMSVEEAGRAARQMAFAEVADAAWSGPGKDDRLPPNWKMPAPAFAEAADAAWNRPEKDDPLPAACPSVTPVRIAVAHNLEDQAETILMRILRGTGTDGLAGMTLMRPDGASHVIIRPLLPVSRAEIEAYCVKNNLAPRRDSTNSETKYHRNLLRMRVMPALEEMLGASAAPALVRLGRNAAEDRDYFAGIMEGLMNEYCEVRPYGSSGKDSIPQGSSSKGFIPYGSSGNVIDLPFDKIAIEARVPRTALTNMHPAVRHRFIRRVFMQIGLVRDISAVHLSAADGILSKGVGGKSVDFPGGCKFASEGKYIVFRKPAEGNAPTRVEKRSRY
ncbi:MAG: tRNA lysidine(34) synthetase TilS [Clostridiales Family XIII bacterium]|jgi:tRNA(Ile)-lysidine synthase|nr:tRNA lysidine(34) synthetase TilS [Clostridiales Family XIII bacterium]